MIRKNQKAEYLFSAIGEIDDRLVHEALEYYPVRKKKVWIPILVACLGAMLMFSASFATVPFTGFLFGDLSPDAPAEEPDYATLDLLMEAQKGSDDYVRYATSDELSDFDGAGIIWQYEEDDCYYVKPISSSQLSRIQNAMGRGENVGSDSLTLSCRVWITDGNGNVRSPYLKDSIGNQDVEIFDYNAEIIPDEDFVDCISDILK